MGAGGGIGGCGFKMRMESDGWRSGPGVGLREQCGKLHELSYLELLRPHSQHGRLGQLRARGEQRPDGVAYRLSALSECGLHYGSEKRLVASEAAGGIAHHADYARLDFGGRIEHMLVDVKRYSTSYHA